MQRFSMLFGVGAIALAAGNAHAITSVLSFPITNNTASDINIVGFELLAPRGVVVDPISLAALCFVSDATRHSSTKNPYDLTLLGSMPKEISFSYSRFGGLVAADGQVMFTLTIDNPANIPFRVRVLTSNVPAPAGGALAIVGLALGARRRRWN